MKPLHPMVKKSAGEYEYRGCDIWRNLGTPSGCYAAWLARINGKTISCDSRADAKRLIDIRLSMQVEA